MLLTRNSLAFALLRLSAPNTLVRTLEIFNWETLEWIILFENSYLVRICWKSQNFSIERRILKRTKRIKKYNMHSINFSSEWSFEVGEVKKLLNQSASDKLTSLATRLTWCEKIAQAINRRTNFLHWQLDLLEVKKIVQSINQLTNFCHLLDVPWKILYFSDSSLGKLKLGYLNLNFWNFIKN